MFGVIIWYMLADMIVLEFTNFGFFVSASGVKRKFHAPFKEGHLEKG